MTNTTVATNIHQTFDVQLYFRTEVTFNLILSTNDLTDFSGLVIGPVFYMKVSVDAGFIQDLCGTTATYTINVGQRNLTSFILRQIYTNYSYCHILNVLFFDNNLTLTLLELRVLFVNYIQTAITSDYLTFWRTLL